LKNLSGRKRWLKMQLLSRYKTDNNLFWLLSVLAIDKSKPSAQITYIEKRLKQTKGA